MNGEDTDVSKSVAPFAMKKHVPFTSINVQEKILKNPIFKSPICSRCLLIYDIYEL
jgi:hypothetical protein